MKFHKRFALAALSAATSLGTVVTAMPVTIQAEEVNSNAISKVEKGSKDNVINVTFADGNQGRITFLEESIFRYNIDPTKQFSKYATDSGTAKIQAQPDESGTYTHPAASIAEDDAKFTISCGTTKIEFSKTDGKMTVKSGDKTVMQEKEPLILSPSGTAQKLVSNEGEDFYGGGTQNGRFVHTGESISISNTNNWTDGGVASPNPFYWSTNGYGVLRNTFKPGTYDFGKTTDGTVSAQHEEREFDAYYFVSGADEKAQVSKDLLQDYFKVTGNPVLLPEYAFYLGHLNCYNRDSWDTTGSKGWTIKGSEPSTSAGTTLYENGMASGYILPEGTHAESLNGVKPTVNADKFKAADAPREYSARAVIDRYQANDMPFGWFLPNDGYGCGYGQNGYDQSGGTEAERQASLDANLQNLHDFTEYANAHGVSTGLWTQSNLSPIASEKQQLVRDFRGEVNTGGITTLKTDVAWVGSGYTFGLNGIKTAYDIVTGDVSTRPNIVTLDGWAGTQRYGAIWTGDQYGGNWEYIRFHIPTYIGQSLSGNPNIGSDMDGIFGGAPIIATRDYQWKTFTTTMLDMDGWGSYVKSPYTHGDPYTGISRMYLKLKAQLMPYIYTSAASAANIEFGKDGTGNNDQGLPMIRAMMLADDSDYAASKATQYQYLFGDAFLVAPVYQDTEMDEETGNDVRNDIFLPGDENDTWIDYFTGEQYKGGQIISNFDAPLWKLPLFVRGGSIIPMYEENNNPVAISEDNPDGLDKTKRIVEFYPQGTTDYTLYEDDGMTANSTITEDDDYGTINSINYGDHVETHFTSAVNGDKAVLTAEASKGTYEGYDSNRQTKFVVNVSKKPTSVQINGAAGNEVASLDAFEKLGENESGWFYDAEPEMNKYAGDEDFANMHIINAPKVYVKFAKTDVNKNAQTATINGFENTQASGKDVLVESIPAPVLSAPAEDKITSSSIELSWPAVDGATGYDVMVGSQIYHTEKPKLKLSDQPFNTAFTFKARTRTADGYSNWSSELTVSTLDDPWRNTPTPESITWTGDIYGNHDPELAFDHIYQSGDGGFHSGGKAIGESMTVDLGLIYDLDSIEYYPRDDRGNGTVTSMDIALSLDGVHWTDLERQNWERSAETKVVDLKTASNSAARYVRLIPRASVGNFFSASEIRINKKDGTNGWALGSNLQRAEVSDADYSNMKNYLGLQKSEPDTSTFDSQIAAHHADLNNNNIYDVYDYSFTMKALDGGTTKAGEPSGNLFFMADKTTFNAGDIVTVSLYGNNIQNANALGALFNYSTDTFEALVPGGTSGVTGSPFLGDMEDLSRVRTYTDKHGTVNVAFANRGDKALYSGTRVVAAFQLKAKKAGTSADINLAQNTMVIGPTGSCIDRTYEHGFDPDSVPAPQDKVLARSDLNMTITNEALPTDNDGTNVQTLIQQENFDGLFNGSDGRDFEFTWKTDGSAWDVNTHKVPVTIHMGLKEPAPLKSFRVTAGALNLNGKVRKVSAKITFADGSKETYSGGNYDQPSTEYTFTIPDAKKNVNVTNIDFTVEESGSATASDGDPTNGTLTLCEFYITQPGAIAVESITADSTNKKQLNLGSISEVNATVTPSQASGVFTVSSSDEDVAAVDCVQDGGDVTWYVIGKKAGKATITVASATDPAKTASYEVEVGNFIDLTELNAAIARAEKTLADGIVLDSSKPNLEAAIKKAKDALASDSQDTVDYATVELLNVLSSLQYRAPMKSHLINYTGDEGVVVDSGSSQCNDEMEGDGLGTFDASLDKDESTYWHSNWSTASGMPQYVLYDLGKSYDLTDVSFLPRVGRYNGDMFEVELLAGNDKDNLTSVGTWTFEHGAKQLTDRGWKTMTFSSINARYVEVKVLKSGGDQLDSYASMAEINFYAAEAFKADDVDTTQLKLAVDTAKALNAEDYVQNAAWTALEDAIAEAEEMIESPRSQAVVNSIALKLNQALLNARIKPSAEKLA